MYQKGQSYTCLIYYNNNKDINYIILNIMYYDVLIMTFTNMKSSDG